MFDFHFKFSLVVRTSQRASLDKFTLSFKYHLVRAKQQERVHLDTLLFCQFFMSTKCLQIRSLNQCNNTRAIKQLPLTVCHFNYQSGCLLKQYRTSGKNVFQCQKVATLIRKRFDRQF